jgi:hypothetical protein
MATNIWKLADVGCCILNAASSLLADFGYSPEYQYVGAKGGDYECCSNLVVVLGDSFPYGGNDPKCATMRSYRFAVEVGVCVNESLTCSQIGTCCDLPQRFDPCSRPFPSKSAESRFLLGLRHVLESGLPREITCCLSDGTTCDGQPLNIRCGGIAVDEVTTSTEGACHVITTVVTVTM